MDHRLSWSDTERATVEADVVEEDRTPRTTSLRGAIVVPLWCRIDEDGERQFGPGEVHSASAAIC
ncbi:MAG: hypothetical protein VX661_02725 [Pseudomonadota bacterium]|nr:hypothetical protein [Pseudomonadota bacterium]